MTREEQRQQMGLAIVEFEGRYAGGKLQVYQLPAGDGGGAYEVAGINDRYHASKAGQLKGLIEAGQNARAEAEAGVYIEEYTRPVTKFFPTAELAEANPEIEFVLRDSAFNRGAKGAATILQLALGMQNIDGVVGPATRREFEKQLTELGSATVLRNLTKARETYERRSFPWKSGRRDESSKFWKGLSSRWAKAHEVATTRFG